ncbi:MAG: YsnF/AvaK domain-containing protein [Pyrinomonadaceae bacterium]|nr:YsnF/AvaK domain-containing protein [Pyrinomonadaceae bacterium]
MTAGATTTGTTTQTGAATESTVIPVIAEELHVGKRVVETGRVRIRKFVREHEETVDEPLMAEEVRVERVAVNRVIDAPVDVRYEDGRMIIPLMEEVLVVEKRLMLKEELHVTRQQVERRNPQVVTLRSEEVEIERADGEMRTQEGDSERSQ